MQVLFKALTVMTMSVPEQTMQQSLDARSAQATEATFLPRAFVGTQAAYQQICAYGAAMGWSDKPFDFVVQQWLASRPERSYRELMALRR